MDGYKKIARLILLIYIAGNVLVACKTQKFVSTAIYVGDVISLSDTSETNDFTVNPLKVDTLTRDNQQIPENTIDKKSYENAGFEVDVIDAINRSGIDTVYITKEIIKTGPVSNYAPGSASATLPDAKSDTIKLLQKQTRQLQSQQNRRPDTVYITRQIIKSGPVSNPATINKTATLPEAESDAFKLLQNQVLYLLSQLNTIPDTVYTSGKIINPVPVNDTIAVNDTAILAKTGNDSVISLQKQILQLLSQISTIPDTVYIQESKIISVYDSLTIVDYYNIGKVASINEDSIIGQIKQLNENRDIIKVIISGYTDISGNEAINKAITNKRLNYFAQKTESILPIEKIYLRNFADRFASKNVIENERRIVITLIMKK